MDPETLMWCNKHDREVGINEARYRCAKRPGGGCKEIDILPRRKWAKSPKRRGP